MSARLSYADSCRFLQTEQLLDEGPIPTLPERPPRYDDEVFGVSFFRTGLTDGKAENLTLPRTYIARSDVRRFSFRHSDLSESVICWNDFTDVDFSFADLSHVDLRASIFLNVNFHGANLRNTDLRRSSFKHCIFKDADLAGAKLTRKFKWLFSLSSSQRRSIDWQITLGEEPKGG